FIHSNLYLWCFTIFFVFFLFLVLSLRLVLFLSRSKEVFLLFVLWMCC
ncbi:hypothetical protein TorRG33x02_187370, partial [Trema orientale]